MSVKIDFSALDALIAQKPTQDPQDSQNTAGEYKPMPNRESALKSLSEAPVNTYTKLIAEQREKDRQSDAADKQIEVYRAYQEAIRHGTALMCEITKGVTTGTAPIKLLLQACEVISDMTGDKTFLEQVRHGLIAIYGVGLLEPTPLELELKDVQNRLDMLTRPELGKEPEEKRQQIRAAIKAHEERIAVIEARISASDKKNHTLQESV